MMVRETPAGEPPRQRSWSRTAGRGLLRGLLALGLIALGALGAFLVLRVERPPSGHPRGVSSPPAVVETPAMPAPATEPPGDVEVFLLPAAVAQAGIQTAEVTTVESGTSVQVPGTVMANAYREVKIFPSEVWAVGDLYEQDFRHVRVGSDAALTTLAYPDLMLRGRVTYIDPRVDPHTRTAKVRVEVSNPEGRLRLGMYVTVSFSTPSQERVIVVPRAAVQTIGGRHVVFVAVPDEEGKFLQRHVELGPLTGESYPVRKGLQPGEVVVTEGSFFLRAESMRNAPGS